MALTNVLVFAIILFVSQTTSLKCYLCVSENGDNPECANEFNATSPDAKIQLCDKKRSTIFNTMLEIKENDTADEGCAKFGLTAKAGNPSATQTYYARSCFEYSSKEAQSFCEYMEKAAEIYNYTIDECFSCKTDLCNL